ncbi:MAG: EF-P lysine aminoacylase EpmA [Patescibacteria group bacterium]|nr:EF-P lysine aminoacylase EpmA [Patescibacteria group bacterium]
MNPQDFQAWLESRRSGEFHRRLETRGRTLAAVREFFVSEGFMEVETPILVARPGMEPNLDVFATEVRDESGHGQPAYLITSPEYSLKKLLAAGYERIFEITKCFRNGEPFGGTHNPEFTMIEWYRAQTDYTALMADTEQLVARCAERIAGGTALAWRGMKVDVAPPWPRLTVAEAMDRYAGLDLGRGIDDPDWFRAAAAEKGIIVAPTDSWDDVFYKIFLRDVEPRLGLPEAGSSVPARPVIIYEYPRSMAALARLKPCDGRYAERFEAYCLGLELGNAFSELTDAAEQRSRLTVEAAARQKACRIPWEIDEDFLAAVGAMPPSAGIAFGLDRLVMLLTDAPSIEDVLFFPAAKLFDK